MTIRDVLPSTAPQTLGALLNARAAATPNALAFSDASQQLTFGQLTDAAASLARRLADAGLSPGDRVALVLPAGVAFAEAFWAAQILGAVPCAFNPSTLRMTLKRRVEAIRPRVVVTGDLDVTASTPDRSEFAAGDERLAFLQRTSGTTGEPRAAILTQRNVLAQLRATCVVDGLDSSDVLVSWVPPWHDFGLVRFVIAPVFIGAVCHIVRPAIRTIPEWLSTIERVRATHTGAPDFAYRLACRLVSPRTVDLSSLRYAANGGEPVRRSTIVDFEALFGTKHVVAPGYGLAEATLGVTVHPPGEDLVVDERENVSCGRPLTGFDVRIAGDGEQPGEILVRGDSVFAGYLDEPDVTAAVLCDGWLHTGDVGYLDQEGRLFVLGRRRALIKRAGGVVAPRELEDAAHTVPGVLAAAAIGVAASTTGIGERIIVIVEADHPEGDDSVMRATVSAAVRDRLGFAPHEVRVARPRTIPRTGSGKIRYDELRELLATAATGALR